MSALKGCLGFKGETGYSPTAEVTKADGVATISITDKNGTHTTTISDGEITKAMVVDNLTTSTTDVPLSANQGKVLKTAVDNCYTKAQADSKFATSGSMSSKVNADDIMVIEDTIDLSANTAEKLAENQATTSTKDLTYPTGFTKDNCYVVACMIGRYSGGSYVGWSSNSLADCELSTMPATGGYPRTVSLVADKVTIRVGNYTTSAINGVPFKIVLQKLPAVEILRHEATEVTTSTIYITWETDADRDKTQYSLDNGSTWTDAVDEIVDNRHGGYEITGLTSGTTYSIKSRFKRASSQVWTESSALSVTTE